jgi:hypothetical protein
MHSETDLNYFLKLHEATVKHIVNCNRLNNLYNNLKGQLKALYYRIALEKLKIILKEIIVNNKS